MSECVVRMEMPHVCITDNGYYGYCPMDRIWCIQRNAPPDITMREAYEAMTDKIPSWCPIICQLPEGHGRLVDTHAIMLPKGFFEKVDNVPKFYEWLNSLPTIVPAERSEHERTD